ncbi:rhodanese-like domain-containing protein [Lamprobacter modestohalophilus]|uniref:rhodanese-like domain-containing protein n=1 Tax=Lamprobacter modestohalophilus TaxID=1064514 RepID=UPI002ADEDA35|nr:rhodanese-like domain-containing protein [Lamprobacter modestohalophilus]MEA1052165.1 rhodanese-like domain-containing protein [Lamprobacter modestohalophilus]
MRPIEARTANQARCQVAPTLLATILTCSAPIGLADETLPAIQSYLAAGPIENFLLQPEALPDDPSDEFYLVFDVRSAAEFEHGEALPSAEHIPYTDIAPLLETLGDDRSQPALIYCQTMLRSTQVVMALRLLGYDNVWYLSGGIDRWRTAGKPLTSSE